MASRFQNAVFTALNNAKRKQDAIVAKDAVFIAADLKKFCPPCAGAPDEELIEVVKLWKEEVGSR